MGAPPTVDIGDLCDARTAREEIVIDTTAAAKGAAIAKAKVENFSFFMQHPSSPNLIVRELFLRDRVRLLLLRAASPINDQTYQ